jgi:predicted lysophospholipase L1 biosynthesis ABC-type transport system permease subunit
VALAHQGVLPADSVFDRGTLDVYVPLSLSAADAQNNGRQLTVLARLTDDDASLEQAQAEMTALATAFNQERGDAGRGWTAAVTPLRDVVIGADTRWLAAVLFGAVVTVLLVACLNVAGLSLSRTVVRRREIAIRSALGASRWRVFRYLVVESVLLAVAGGAVGVLLGAWGLRAFISLVPPGLLPAEAVAFLDGRALLFTVTLSVITGLLFGTFPAWRGTAANPIDALMGSGRTAGPTRITAGVHSVLLIAEVALSMVLVVAASALVLSFIR